jgi:hypothetical protein
VRWLSIVLAASLLAMPERATAQVRDSGRVVYTGTAVVTGTVLAAGKESVPLRRAMVTLTRTGVEDIRIVATDDRGRYRFSDLPAGTFRLSAIKGGFIGMSWGAPKPGMPGRSIQLIDGQVYAAEPVALTRGAVIAGRLLDRNGRPAGATTVEATQFISVGGERRRRIGAGSYGSAMTDDHGEYRIFGLLPGDYIVFVNYPPGTLQTEATPAELSWAQQPGSVAPPRGRAHTYAPTLFPGVGTEAAAAPVRIEAGEEKLSVDFALQYVPVSTISGTLTGPDGAPVRGTVERSLRLPGGILTPNGEAVPTANDGSFLMTGVPPGDWVLMSPGWANMPPLPIDASRFALTPGTRGAWPLAGRTEVTVAGADVTGVSIRLQPAATIAGMIVARGSTTPPDLTRITMQLLPLAPSGGVPRGLQAPGDASGRFLIEGIPPGRYRVTATMPRGAESPWCLRSAMLGDRDLIDVPFEVQPGDVVSGLSVTFTDARSELSGTISDTVGRAVSQLYVLVFSTDRSQWDPGSRRTSSALANDNGAYTIQGLPPGEYYLCALTELDTTRVSSDPSYLEELVAASIKLTLGEAEKRRQDLRVSGKD